MNLPIDKNSATGLLVAALFGLVFGFLLNKGRMTDYNVIVNFFRLRNLRMLQVMLSAIVFGGIGVALLHWGGLVDYHIKSLVLPGILLGGALFGVGMVVYGYCPGTGVAAMATGSVHAVVGFFGMIAGGIAYGFSHPWLEANVLSTGDFGKLRLGNVLPLPDVVWWMALFLALAVLYLLLPKPWRKAPQGYREF